MSGPISHGVWNPDRTPEDFAGRYHDLVLEQYKLYVEMADRISARRSLTNSFFLTLNTSAFTVIGLVLQLRPGRGVWTLIFPTVALVVQCGAWYFLLRSYRQLNTAKYRVVGELEERLPASPYWRAEWAALGHGRDRTLYTPITHLEQWVPVIFAITYVVTYVVAVLQ
ncbi:hypothetical protein ACFU44_01120 [Nocardia rhizosphaerihabitans]|uniref:RipA family octameric membrane protein n=1 Tax=Nocardia rhizosphaerihabitans TaxID=1691570 RepID=UPI00366CA69A